MHSTVFQVQAVGNVVASVKRVESSVQADAAAPLWQRSRVPKQRNACC